jgi:hypothetical protein
MSINTDIDIDFGSRDAALSHLKHYSASISKKEGIFNKHATGVYFSDIPHDVNGQATIDYIKAEERGYFKIDFLNVSVYEHVKSEEHLDKLINTVPPWHRLLEKEFCEKLIHIGDYWKVICKLPEPIDSIPRLAMFIAMIRPAKRHLMGLPWSEVVKTIWEKPTDGSYAFKKSHSVGYSHLIVVNMNLLTEQGL